VSSLIRRRRLPVATLAAAVAVGLALCGLWPGHADAATRPCVLFLEPTTDRENIIFPEATTTYESGSVPIPPGGYTEITGEFPHSRFFSFQTSGENGKNIGGLLDQDIQPDPGSTNPFVPGADRTTTHRSYTVRVLDAPMPASGPAPNTLYSMSTDGTTRTLPGNAIVTLRYYLPDIGLGRLAGVPAPTITMVTATGQQIPTPTCPDNLGDPGYTQAIASFGPPDNGVPGTGPLVAHRVPVWHKFVNAPTGLAGGLTDNDALGQDVYDRVSGYTTRLPAGFFENIYINYIYTATSTAFGGVVEMRAKLPTHPHTYYGESPMGTGQVRFWSMCTANYPSTATYACVVDKDMPLDREGDFTLVVSPPADRPANAFARCGVAWLPAGPTNQTVVIMRNMLPAPGFSQAIQNVQPGHEQAEMGPYFPVSRYYQTKTDFERLGCPASAARGRAPAAHRRRARRHRKAAGTRRHRKTAGTRRHPQFTG
jgi:hypothetical protein